MVTVRVWSVALPIIAALVSLFAAPVAEAATPRIGVVLMHGKGGSPAGSVAPLASALELEGLLVLNLEMPWSGRRGYDVDVATAEAEVQAAVRSLRERGAESVFVAGHSQGGLFALHFGGSHAVDGVIAIAPGGNVASPAYREALGPSVEQARQFVASGKGAERVTLRDFEASRSVYFITTTPAAYLSWFDPDGAMNELAAARGMNPAVPVLFIAPTGDYPGLRKVKQQVFEALPKNPSTRLVEPSASHRGAPAASAVVIVDWMRAVASAARVGAQMIPARVGLAWSI